VTVAVVGVRHVQVQPRLEEVSNHHDLGGGIGQSLTDIVEVFTSHDDDEVVAVQVVSIGELGQRAMGLEAGTVECGSSARVHGGSHVPIRGTRTGDVNSSGQNGVVADKLTQRHFGHW